MRFIRSRFGIVVWCAIALIILIVPLWRLRAERQLHTSVVEVLIPVFSDPQLVRKPVAFGLDEIRAHKSARRFPNDVSAQLSLFDFKKLVQEKRSIEKPLSDYATDEIYLQKWRDSQPRMWKLTDDYFSRYAEVQQRFPGSNLVRAQYLRDTTGGNLIADEGYQPDLVQLQKDQKIIKAIARERTQLWMSPQARRAALDVALAGAKSEEENAFWPWMQAVLQFSLGNDEGALRALEAAGQCVYFDDYALASVQSRLQTLGRVQAVGWEDDFVEWSSFWLPHNAKIRSAARAAMGRMREARKRGDRKTELRWEFATFRAGAVMARPNRVMLITSLVGEAVCAISWKAAVEPLHRAETKRPEFFLSNERANAYYKARDQNNANNFMDWARLNGRPDIVRETQTVIASFGVGRLIIPMTADSDSLYWKIDSLTRNYWLGAQFLILTLASALIWCACHGLTRARSSQVAALRTNTLTIFMFGAGLTLAALVSARFYSPSLQAFTAKFIGLDAGDSPPFSALEMRLMYPLTVGCLWLILIGAKFFSGDSSKKFRPVYLVFFGLCLGFFGVSSSIGKPMDSLYEYIFRISGFTFVTCMFAMLWIIGRRLSGRARAFGICVAATILIPMYFVLYYNSPPGSSGSLYSAFVAIATSVFLIASIVLGWGKIRFRFGIDRSKIQAYIFQLVARTRIAAGVLALLCAVAYFGITLWTIPVEAKMRAMMQRQLQIGEVAWLREQIAAK